MNTPEVVREPILASDTAARVSRVGLAIGVLGLLLALALGASKGDGMRHFFWAYLVAFAYVFTLTLGGMFFTLIQHATGAKWSVSVRRLGEFAMNTVPLLMVMALPFLYPLFTHSGVDEYGGLLWPWIHAHGEHAELVEHKSPFLNTPFFLGHMVFYFAVWMVISRFFMKRSLMQDADRDLSYPHTVKMRKLSAPSIIAFALTLSFAAFDWLMSTDPIWFSTIFGVYIFAGCVLAIHSWIVLSSVFLQKRGYLKGFVNTEHYHDLGKFMLAFTIFWAYIAYSQFMLIWYANIPEETGWFQHRITPAWESWSYALILTNFAVPFFGILSRHVKRNKAALAFWAAYILVVHFIDLYWVVMPNMDPHNNPFSLMDVSLLVGMVGLFVWAYARQATKSSILAYGDPKLKDCLAHVNF
ncbi:MAG: quinol:cytochrome C oxidoreductase [Planctomycetes bacterium]|nr:quinol:cytochrome C oxidoreductase [Planctomycetota bacterium]